MANLCDNRLYVSGDKEKIEEFKFRGIKNREWRLCHYLPMPKEIENTMDIDCKNQPDWWEWRIQNYGCKWDCMVPENEIVQNEEGTMLMFFFESPWRPPLAFLEKIQVMFPDIDFKLSYFSFESWYAGIAKTLRNAETAEVSIVVRESEPEYWDDETGKKVECEDEAALEEYEKSHKVSLVNPFDLEMWDNMPPWEPEEIPE